MKTFLAILGSALFLLSCAAPPYLYDDEVLPVGSALEFWVYHDNVGWVESNIHIAHLPREMTGLEARRWAAAVGDRDARRKWTHYYLRSRLPKGWSRTQILTSPVYSFGK